MPNEPSGGNAPSETIVIERREALSLRILWRIHANWLRISDASLLASRGDTPSSALGLPSPPFRAMASAT